LKNQPQKGWFFLWICGYLRGPVAYGLG